MPLFVCDQCKCIDNTACENNFWDFHAGAENTCKCTECDSGKWHERFEKREATTELIEQWGRDLFMYTAGL